ncbi:TraR/DksA C4-type zinc finger protein [Streptomyces sp. NPDC005908]|uniref:Molecular chaperone DnaK n=1 Tax=Streptomyces tendae TaxID=1932 RepID=A0ABX5ZS48_STRTE|nr:MULTISPECIES: TraR/DksA C4-type zinc finger protein [Streptomyces]QER87114.1 molecular chaperone DnaK [Streptomyces tendae]TWD29774.1 TraR/DksA family transcriptional regulator [Streptomyces sp. T12]
MSLDLPRTEPRTANPAADEVRRRLEHARTTRLAQLKALDESGDSPGDHLMSNQKDAIKRVLTEIDEAFARVDAGTYGDCLGCSKPVPPERLEILPHTRYCVACQRRAS